MKWLKILKISFLYIGTVIGAGFGTGRELVTFFKETSQFTIILGGIALGVFSGFYLYLGKRFKEKELSAIAFGKYNKIFDFIVNTSVFFVLAAMLDTSDSMIKNIFGIDYGGYFTIAFCLLAAVVGMNFIKKINALVIPAIIVMIIFIFSKSPGFTVSGGLNLFAPLSYAGMNIMLAGYVIFKDGRDMSSKEIAMTALLVSILFSLIMTMLYETVRGNYASMPFYEVAVYYGYKYLAGAVIFFAIVTTALSCASLTLDYVGKVIKNRYAAAIMIFLAAIPVKIFVGFENIVDYVYPAVSLLGIMTSLFALASLLKLIYKEKKSEKLTNYSINL